MTPSRPLAPLALSTATRMNNPRAIHTDAALQALKSQAQKSQVQKPQAQKSQAEKVPAEKSQAEKPRAEKSQAQTSQSPTQSANIIKQWQDAIPNGADPDGSVQELRTGSLGTKTSSFPSFQFPRSQPKKGQPISVLQPTPREQPVYTTPNREMYPALQPEYEPPSLISMSRAQHSVDKFPPLQPTPRPQLGYTAPVLQPTPRVHTPTISASPEDPIYTTPVLQRTPRAQKLSISGYISRGIQAPSPMQSQSDSTTNTEAFEAAVEHQNQTRAASIASHLERPEAAAEHQKQTQAAPVASYLERPDDTTPVPQPAPQPQPTSEAKYDSHGLAVATRFVGSGQPKTGNEIGACQAKIKSELQNQVKTEKIESAGVEGTCHSDLKGIEILPDPDSPHQKPIPPPSPKTKEVLPPTPVATPAVTPTMATLPTPTPAPVEPTYLHPSLPASGPPPTNHESGPLPATLKRTKSTASIAETSVSLTSTISPRTRLLISLPRARLRIIKLSRCPDTGDLEEFLLQAVGIPSSEKRKYEILWVRETERWGVEEVCMDGEDAWEFLREEVEVGADGAEGKKGREVRIRVVEVGKE